MEGFGTYARGMSAQVRGHQGAPLPLRHICACAGTRGCRGCAGAVTLEGNLAVLPTEEGVVKIPFL